MCSGLTNSKFANRDRNGILLLTNENDKKEEFLMKHSSWTQADSQEETDLGGIPKTTQSLGPNWANSRH